MLPDSTALVLLKWNFENLDCDSYDNVLIPENFKNGLKRQKASIFTCGIYLQNSFRTADYISVYITCYRNDFEKIRRSLIKTRDFLCNQTMHSLDMFDFYRINSLCVDGVAFSSYH